MPSDFTNETLHVTKINLSQLITAKVPHEKVLNRMSDYRAYCVVHLVLACTVLTENRYRSIIYQSDYPYQRLSSSPSSRCTVKFVLA